MDATQNLYYALGEIAYSIAKADGTVQKEERELLHNIVVSGLDNNNFDVSEIIFSIMNKEHTDTETSYKWGMKEMNLNSHHLTSALKEKFISVIEKIAAVFPPVTIEEKNIVDRFKEDMNKIYIATEF